MADAVSYCNDPTVERDWQRLLHKYEGVDEWQQLYRFRKQVCQDLESGKITLDDAISKFEQQRKIKIKELQQRLEGHHFGASASLG